MKILVVSQYFYPENFRINDLVLELKNKGHEITVLTGKPNYPQGVYYDGYTFKGNEDETWNNIRILRVPLRARKSGAINLIKNYCSFVYNANKKVKKINECFDIIYVFEVSPMTVALPAIKLKKLKNIPIIMNVQDLWPENIQAVTGIDNAITNCFLNKLVNYIYKNVDLILTASPAFNKKIEKRVDNSNKIKYWPQYSPIYKIQRDNNEKIFNENNFNIVFTGNIGDAQGLDIVIDAAKHLNDTKIVFHLVGDGRKKKDLEKTVYLNKLEDKVIFHGQVDESVVPSFLSEADMALLILKPNPVFDMTIPAKLQTYLACGCPILGCVQGISKEIIDKNKLGITTVQVSSNALSQKCKEIMQMKESIQLFASNALNYSETNFNKQKLVEQLEKYMEEILDE